MVTNSSRHPIPPATAVSPVALKQSQPPRPEFARWRALRRFGSRERPRRRGAMSVKMHLTDIVIIDSKRSQEDTALTEDFIPDSPQERQLVVDVAAQLFRDRVREPGRRLEGGEPPESREETAREAADWALQVATDFARAARELPPPAQLKPMFG